MAEERMLSDEILLGLIKANGGGGGTNDYNDLLNQPSINNTTLEGDMSAEDLGLANKTTVDGILNGTDIDSFADVETALNGKQASLSVGDYIDISNGEISVDRVIPNEIVSYKIVTKNVSSSQQDNTITVTKMVNGVVAWSNDYTAYELEQEHAEHRVVFDDMLWVGYGATSGGQWCYGVLEASDTHSAGYVYDWSWYVEVDITEEFSTVDHSGEKLIIKSEMDTALAGKADTGIVADDFDSTASYVIGNYCIENGKLYRFKANHSGIWSSADVDEIQIAGELATLESGLTTLDNEVNGDATVYPYADVITIEDAVPANVADCSVKIEPVQDLHGYDKPWVGGAGKNKLPLTVDGIKTANTSGTWNGNAYTLNDVTFTVDTDSDGNVTSIVANGTASANADLLLNDYSAYLAASYNLRGCPASGSEYTYCLIAGTSSTRLATDTGLSSGFTLAEETSLRSAIRIFSGYTATNLTFYPMIRLATETDATFAPYTNICPITGHTEASVVVTDGDETTKTYTIALGDTIYGGTVDFNTGVMTVDRAYAEFDGSSDENWTLLDNGKRVGSNILTDAKRAASVSDVLNNISNQFKAVSAITTYGGNTGFDIDSAGMLHVADGTSNMVLNDWKTHLASNPLQVVYELATPFTVQLTPEQIQLLKGTNTLTASTGQISVTVDGVSGSIGQVQEQVNEIAEDVEDIEDDVTELQGGVTNLNNTNKQSYERIGYTQRTDTENIDILLGGKDLTNYDVVYIVNSYYDQGVATYGSLLVPTKIFMAKYSTDSGIVMLTQDINDNLIPIYCTYDYTTNKISINVGGIKSKGRYYVVFGVKYRNLV